MIDSLIEGFQQVWEPAVVVVAILSGVAAGVLAGMVIKMPVTSRTGRWYVLHASTMVVAVTLPLWIGRISYSLFTADPHWGRVVAGFMLIVFYAVWVGVGLSIAVRLRAQRWMARWEKTQGSGEQ